LRSERAVGIPLGADLRARRRGLGGAARAKRPHRRGASPARHPDRGLAVLGQVRQADPLCRAPRHPVRLVPTRGRLGGHWRGQGHPLRRAGAGRRGRLEPAGRGPRRADPPVIARLCGQAARGRDLGTVDAASCEGGWDARAAGASVSGPSMTGASAAGSASVDVSVIVGVDCSGRTHRLELIAATAQRPVLRVNPPGLDADRLAKDLAEAGDALVLVDDAHRLSGDELAALTAAARRGTAIILARRPSIPSPAHADLEEALPGRVEQLQPLEAAAIGELMARCWERPVTPAEAESLHAACGGLPGIAVLLTPPAEPGPSLVARVQRRLAVLPPPIAALARLLALRLDL